MEQITINSIDLSYLHTISAGDTTFERMVLLAAVDDITVQIEKLGIAFKEKDGALIKRIAHSLKAVVAIAGLSNLETICWEIDKLFRDEKYHENGISYFENLVNEWDASRPIFEEMITENYPDF